MTLPFQYPPSPHERRHGPRGYPDYARFRPWLRDEFSFRCVYCLSRERWSLVRGIFHIDHFLPVAVHPGLTTEYDNLLYACASCNFAKGVRPLPDPLITFTAGQVRVDQDGTIHSNDNAEAARLIELLGLNSADYVAFRKLWIDILELLRERPEFRERFLDCFGYPVDIPNLRRLRPPEGNSRPAGLEQSAFARKQRGELPSVY